MNAPKGEETIFAEALRLPPEERAAYLAQSTIGNAELRQRVESLLGSYATGNFLEQAAAPQLPQTFHVTIPLTEKPGDTIGRYKLLQQIGEGGCGVVYMAEQTEPVRRRVALKIIKLGLDTKSVIARFEAERQAVAMMDHPNIAKVFDAGATEAGRPYFVMELVRGMKITEYCDEAKLSTRARLDLFIQVCQAIQHAHQKGIIHRDIKPSNILVTVNDGVPVPKVIDFGIAKATSGQQLTDKTVFTAFEQFIGTPAYMSPEQAVLTSVDIDTRSDVYALGVLLYELLTGKTPFDAKELLAIGLDEMRRTIRETEPPLPSTRFSTLAQNERSTTAQRRGIEAPKLASELRGDLDWIVMKALEKDRARRYETPTSLASDIERHLNDEAVMACPPSNLYRFQKMVRRNKLVFAAGMSVAAALVIGLGVASWMFFQERAALKRAVSAERAQTFLRQKAEAEERNAVAEAAKSKQVAQFLQDMLKGVAPSVARGRDTTLLREILDQTAARLGKDLTNQPGVEAELRRTLGRVYFDLGDLKNSEDMGREALRLQKSLAGPNDAFVAGLLGDLASTINEMGNDRPGAELLARESLAINRKLFGPDHRSVVISLRTLGWVLLKQNKDSEAEDVYRRSLAMAKNLTSSEDQDFFMAGSLSMLALSLSRVPATLAEAESLQRQALAIERKRGIEDLNLATLLGNLGAILGKTGKIAEANAADLEQLAIERKLLEPGHPRLVKSLGYMGRSLEARGNLDESEKIYREVLSMSQKLSPDNSDVMESLEAVMRIAEKQGRRPEEAVEIYQSLPAFPKSRGHFSAIHGDWQKAATDLRRASELNPYDAELCHWLAPVLVQVGELDAYREFTRKNVERFKTTTDPMAAERIAKDWLILPSTGDNFETAKTVAELADRAVSTAHRYVSWCQLVKGLAEYRQNHFRGAAEWLERALTKAGESSECDVQAYSVLAMAYYRLEQPGKARTVLREGSDLADKKLAKLESGHLGNYWDCITAHVLMREAKALLDNDSEITTESE
ncbi:MAG: eukaryotic-like serine/threonine-protein kinase [Verrucomicrobiota bacterium]|jgi:tetratricopeptide (TPR) repeat protein/tRNA A-37 threonylcarbamoyl transferase component Bud32